MKGKRYSDEQIVGILKTHEAGAKAADLVREHGISEQSFYRWKSKYGGMEVSEAKRLKELEAENAKLKKLLAEAELDKSMLMDVLSKKWWGRLPVNGWLATYRSTTTSVSAGPAG